MIDSPVEISPQRALETPRRLGFIIPVG